MLCLPRLPSVVGQVVPQEEIQEQNNLLQALFTGCARKITKFSFTGDTPSNYTNEICSLKLPHDMLQGTEYKLHVL